MADKDTLERIAANLEEIADALGDIRTILKKLTTHAYGDPNRPLLLHVYDESRGDN